MKKLFITVIISVSMVLYSTSLLAADGAMTVYCWCLSGTQGDDNCSCTNDHNQGWREKLTPLDTLLVNVYCPQSLGHNKVHEGKITAVEVGGEDISCNRSSHSSYEWIFGCTNKSVSATHYVHVTSVSCSSTSKL